MRTTTTRLVPALIALASPVLALCAAAPSVAAPAPAAHRAPAVDGSAKGGAVIVRLKDQHRTLKLKADAAARTSATHADQRALVADMRSHGGTRITQLVSVNAVAAHLPAAEVARLRADPAVAQVTPDSTESVLVTSATPTEPTPPKLSSALCPKDPKHPLLEPEALRDTHATDANKIATGKGVIVANDGINELAGNPNFQRADGSHVVIDAPDYSADHSDGEYYGDASSIAAQGRVVYDFSRELPYSGLPAGCTFTLKGIAPDASLVDTSLIDTPPSATTGFRTESESQIVAGIDHAVMVEHADIISESYGYTPRPGNYAIHYAANDAAIAAGVTVTVSSGDSGVSGTVSSPASDPQVIAVGATNTLRLNAQAYGYKKWINDNITPLSSGGTTPNNRVVDLVAPGYGGEAACSPSGSDCPTNTITEAFGGTSQSCPLVAAAAADVIQAYADSHGGTKPTPAQVKQILTGSATDTGAPADQQGAGLLDVDAAVKAARNAPGSTDSSTASSDTLVPSPSQLELAGNGGTTTDQAVRLYNSGAAATTVHSTYRTLSAQQQFGTTTTESVSAPDPSQPVPAEGATAAAPIKFTVPAGLNRMSVDMIVPDPVNSTILSFTLLDPKGRLTQISYDYGTAPTRTGQTIGTTPNIQHVEVAAPDAGRWTAKILWANGRAHLQEPPNVPGSYRGTISMRETGQHFVSAPAAPDVTIPAHASADVPLSVAFPAEPGDHPQSVQFSTSNGPAQSYPIARRTLIPSGGGEFDTTITSTVGRQVGQVSTFDVDVPAGKRDLEVDFHTPDASADNRYAFYLVNPSGVVVAQDATPTTTLQGNDATEPKALASLVTTAPVAGRWEVDVVLSLTVSGKEFTQTVYGSLGYDRASVQTYALPNDPSTTIAANGTRPVSLGVTNPTTVGRTFSLTGSAGDVTSTPVYIPAGATALVTGTITPKAAVGTAVTGVLSVISTTSSTSSLYRNQTIATLPYAYTVGAPTT